MATKCSMPEYVARCVEEISLEGRCGLPVQQLFDLTDTEHDVAYRRYAWRVLSGMKQLRFHVMKPLEDPKSAAKKSKQVDKKPIIEADNGATLRRKRKWSTTLLNNTSSESPQVTRDETAEDGGRLYKRQKHQPLQPVIPSMRRIAAKKQRRRLSDAEESRGDSAGGNSRVRRRRRQNSNDDEVIVVGHAAQSEVVVKDDPTERETQVQVQETETRIKKEPSDAADETQWVLRSPRGFRLGEEVDVVGLNYEEAMESSYDGVLGVVACEEIRLQYLGVVDPNAMDTISPQFDLLEIIGRARERGENAATLTNSRLFGDSRKLHYLLDMLIVSNYVEKNIVVADQKRFNMVHLRRFANQFHPSMVSPSATMAREGFPKELLAQIIVGMMHSRGERTCVFADIGRELGYNKRQQEQIRHYFIQQMHSKPNFPFQLFMARCKTGDEKMGRKLWCVRLRDKSFNSSGRCRGMSVSLEELDSDSATGRPVIERGIMEQMFVAIQDRRQVGATVPELRDVLGVPTFKLPYKLAQGLITNYNISVEQVVLGKSTMYRMFVPGAGKEMDKDNYDSSGNIENLAGPTGIRVTRSGSKYNTSRGVGDDSENAVLFQPSTMTQAARGVVRASTIDRRRNYIMKRVQMEKIVSMHQLRTGVIEFEQVPSQLGGASSGSGAMDIRSLRRIVDELVEENKVATMDVTLPPKQVLQKSHRRVRCVVLPGYQRSREAIHSFVEAYEEEQQKKYLANFEDHENGSYVVVTNRHKQRSGSIVQEVQNQEVVTFNATSYKLARVQQAKLQKQSRRLGMFYGMLYRCRAFHLMVWERIQLLKDQDAGKCTDIDGPRNKSASCLRTSTEESVAADSGEIEFALQDVLDLLTVKEYVQLVGVPELLSESEESSVRSVISKGLPWKSLEESIIQKVRSCEADRFSKILRVLLELKLFQVVSDTSSKGLFNIFQSSDDFDSVVSRVAFATLSGGLFKVKRRARISIRQGSSVLHQLPSKYSYAYAPRFSCKGRSDHFSGRVPLEFDFKGIDDAKAYWKSLRFLSVEGAQLGNSSVESNGISVDLDGTPIQSAPLPDLNIYTMKTWVPHSTTAAGRSDARLKAAAGSIQLLKRKRYQSGVLAVEPSTQKKQKITKIGDGLISAFMNPVGTSDAAVSKFRKQVGAKRSCRVSKWTLEEDLQLVDLYLERLSCRWFVEVPLALQYKDERVAFRTTALSRTLISWKELATALKKKPVGCMLRVNDLLEAPAIQARVERAKAAITEMKNPGGGFHEELAIMRQPRLTALLCRALQVIFHERSSYYSFLADMLMSSWNESEVKLVWRYLWLAGLITRTPLANQVKDQKQRGFQVHSKVYEMKSLKIPHYLMATFCEAAKYLSFVNENVAEVVLAAEENERYFEHEIEVNMPSGQAAAALSSMTSGFSYLAPVYMAPGDQSIDSLEVKRAMSVKGLAGHLSRKWSGVLPEAFLKEYWTVKSVFGVSDGVTQAQNIKSMEAFSCCDPVHSNVMALRPRTRRKRNSKQQSLPSWLAVTLAEAAEAGIALREMCEKYSTSTFAKLDKSGTNSSPAVLLQRELDEMAREGKVFEVNGYDHIRYVLREFADKWTLQPYRIASGSATDKIHFVFDQDSSVVARPWLHLDGSTNTKVALKLKRKVVNIVMCCPGIQDNAVHKKMRKILSLQDMRSLMEELIAAGIVYARAFRDPRPPAESIFGMPTYSPSREADILTVSPGELRWVNFSRDRLHYFPSVNCMELLGGEACDADLG